MTDMQCPNCGQPMVPYRRDRQRAGQRTIELLWAICEDCRHVGLTSWQFADAPPAEPVIESERVTRPRRPAPPSRERLRCSYQPLGMTPE